MTSKIIVNTIEADTGISSVTFASNINLQNDSSVLVSSSGVTLGTGSTIAAPSANEIALSTNNAERIRVDSSGRLLIGRTSALASSAERLTIDDGMAIFRRSSANAAALYIRNEDSTADTRQPYLIFTDGSGNRGGFGVQYNESSLWISGQNGIAFRTGGTAPSTTERVRINSAGNLGIGDASPTKPLTVGTTTPVILLDDQSSRTLEIRGPSTTHNATVLTTSTHDLLLGTNNTERLRIDSDGTLLVNAALDNTGGHGQIVAHAPLTGNTIYKAIEIGNTDAAGTGRGAAICGQPRSNSHLPYTLIGSWDHGDNTDVYYGGGWGGAMRPATRHRFYTNSSYPTSGGSGTERMLLDGNGYLTVSNQPAFFVYKATSAWALAAHDVFVFDTAELNVGGHYNTSNGRFTAPITARYVFHFFSIYTGNATGDSIEMYKNGARMYGGDVHFTNSVGGNWDTVHYSRVIQLSSGDYVHMQTRTGHTFHGNHWGGWSGYMLG